MRANRSVRSTEDWAALRRSRIHSRRDGLRLRAQRRAEAGAPSRFGVAVRATGRARAVARNRTKRRLRGAFEKIGPARGWDVALWADPSAANLPYQELEKHLKEALHEAGVR